MEKAVLNAEKSAAERLEIKYRHDAELAAKEIEGERKLSKQMISGLEGKIKEQEELIRQLTQKANEAGNQVQNIAFKAIEGAAAIRSHSVPFDRVPDQPKG